MKAEDYMHITHQDACEIFVGENDGCLYHPNGALVDTSDAFHIDGNGVRSKAKAIYAMDSRGRIFLSKYSEYGKFHTSSLVAGKPTAIAGEAEIFEGCRGSFNNNSQHYRHDPECIENIREELAARGTNLGEFRFYGISWKV